MKFKTIYADPPWQFNDKLDKLVPYMTLDSKELCYLPIKKIADSPAHIYLWVPSAMLQDGLDVMKAWGFKYKCHIVWLKRTVNWKIHFGMGHYFRHCNELCLFGVKGSMLTQTRNTRNFIEAIKPPRHPSAKPDIMYDIVEKNSPAPYLELFATIKRPNWTSWGFEIDGTDIRSKFKFMDDMRL